jgi:hypothetical protein
METRNCLSCKGTGIRVYGGTIPNRPCNSCKGSGSYGAVDVPAILEAIKGRKGLRSKAPDYSGVHFTVANVRAYYVWRMARFHGGVDVTMPMVAGIMVHGDPFTKELDAVADAVAKRVYGTDRAAAYRWGNALGHSLPVPASMPATAFSCGPVVLSEYGPKPDEELAELC